MSLFKGEKIHESQRVSIKANGVDTPFEVFNESGTSVFSIDDAGNATGTITATDLPAPTASTLGGVKSLAVVASKWINTISTAGQPAATQPAFTDISGSVAASQLPNPTASTLGGVESLAAVTSNWINQISTSGVPSASQPAFTDISGSATKTQVPTAPALQYCGTTTTCGHTVETAGQVVYGTVALNGASPSVSAVTGISPAFTSSSTFVCTAISGTTATTTVKVTYVSGSAVTFTGANGLTDALSYICVGN